LDVVKVIGHQHCANIVMCNLRRPGLSDDDSRIAVLNSAFELFFACFGAIEGAVGNETHPAHFANLVQASGAGWQCQRFDAL